MMEKTESIRRDSALKRDRREVFYNILLPVWLLLFWPTYLWLLLIPANYLIDRFVLKWSLGGVAGARALLPEK